MTNLSKATRLNFLQLEADWSILAHIIDIFRLNLNLIQKDERFDQKMNTKNMYTLTFVDSAIYFL